MVFAGLTITGVVIRALLHETSWATPNSDDANGMLLGLRASQGHFGLTFPGHNYGGALLAWVEGPLVAIFGFHLWVFWLADTAVVVAGGWALFVVARRFVPPVAAAVAGAALACLPPPWLYYSGKETLFYVPSITLAITTCWLILRWFERPGTVGAFLVGLAAGLSIWCDPLAATLITLPVAAFLWRARRTPSNLGLAAVGGLLGVTPWLLYFLTAPNPFAHISDKESTLTTIRDGITQLLPASIWFGPPRAYLGIALYAAAVAGALFFAWKRRWPLLFCASSVVIWPFLLALAHEPVLAAAYRYAFFVLPALLLLAAYGLSLVRLSVAGVAVAMVFVTLSVSSATHSFRTASPCAPRFAGLTQFLVNRHRTDVWGSYWIAPALTACEYPRIVAASTTQVSDRQSIATVAGAPRSTYVVFARQALDGELSRWRFRHHWTVHRFLLGTYAVWVFPDRVSPKQMDLRGAY